MDNIPTQKYDKGHQNAANTMYNWVGIGVMGNGEGNILTYSSVLIRKRETSPRYTPFKSFIN